MPTWNDDRTVAAATRHVLPMLLQLCTCRFCTLQSSPLLMMSGSIDAITDRVASDLRVPTVLYQHDTVVTSLFQWHKLGTRSLVGLNRAQDEDDRH